MFNSSLSDDYDGSHRNLEEGQCSHRATQTNKGESKDMGCQTFLTNGDFENLAKKQEKRKEIILWRWQQHNSILHWTGDILCPDDHLQPCVTWCSKTQTLTKFQQLLLTLKRLRLNLLVQDLAYRFSIHASTVSRTFHACIQTLYSSMDFLVHWPDQENLLLTMPLIFNL